MRYPSIQRWLLENTPLEPALLDGPGFESLLDHRLAFLEVDEPGYLDLLSTTGEPAHLLAGIAVPETWFFRYPHSYRFLEEFLRARLASGRRSLAMASIGCATGEEPFTMAMIALHSGWPPESVSITAIDANPIALNRAADPRYAASSFRSEIPAWAADFLIHEESGVSIVPRVRAMVRFHQVDAMSLATPAGFSAFDVIFCRNLLIYLKPAARAVLLDRVYGALVDDGLLFVGHAETLLCARPGLRPLTAEHTFCLQRCDHVPTPEPMRAAPMPAMAPPTIRAGRDIRRSLNQPLPVSRYPTSPREPGVARPESIPTIDDARRLADAGQNDQCERILRSLLQRGGPTPEALELLGLIRLSAGDTAEARTCFEQAVYLDPARTASILQLAMIYEKRGDQRRADVYWTRARRIASEQNASPPQ